MGWRFDAPSHAEERLASVTLHQIVIVGGGAAGLELATGLGTTLARRKRARVTLVDKARAHLWKPLLHAVAAGSLDFDEHALDYLAQAHWHHFSYRFGEVIGLDRARKQIQLAATHDEERVEITSPRSLHYDTLVIAIGGITNDFGTPGVSQHAIALETPEQAVRFNHRVVNACIRADAQPDPVRPGQLHVAIVGAGATGTELAAELIGPLARLSPLASTASIQKEIFTDRGRRSNLARIALADFRCHDPTVEEPPRRCKDEFKSD